jgi:hypothetical protein
VQEKNKIVAIIGIFSSTLFLEIASGAQRISFGFLFIKELSWTHALLVYVEIRVKFK